MAELASSPDPLNLKQQLFPLHTTWVHVQEGKEKDSSEVRSGAEQRVLNPVPLAMSPAGRISDWTDGGTSVSPQPKDFTKLWCTLTWLNVRASHFKSVPEPQNFFYTSVFPTF